MLDDGLANDVYKAGLDLFLDVGVLCLDTEKLIRFEDNEVKEALRNAPSEITIGEGKDAQTAIARKVEDNRLPLIISGPDGSPISSEELYVPIMESFAKEPVVKALTQASMSEIDGLRIKVGSPLEVIAAHCAVAWTREAARRAGRPGMHTIGSSVAASPEAEIACSNPATGFRTVDGRFVAILNEMKIDYPRLSKLAHFLDYGTIIVPLICPLLGGYVGSPEGTAIVSLASAFAGLLVVQGMHILLSPFDIRYATNTDRANMWISTTIGRALSRNTHLIKWFSAFANAGPCTEMVMYEIATHAVGRTVSGWNISAGATRGGKYDDYLSGMEGRLQGEVGYASIKLKSEDANEIVKTLLNKYENKIANPPIGKKFQECYDIKKITPSKEILEIYSKVLTNLKDFGLDL